MFWAKYFYFWKNILLFSNPISMAVDCIKWHELSKPPIPYLNEPYNVKAKRSKAVAMGYLFKSTRWPRQDDLTSSKRLFFVSSAFLIYDPWSSHFDRLTKDSVTRLNVIIKFIDDSHRILIGQQPPMLIADWPHNSEPLFDLRRCRWQRNQIIIAPGV